MLKRFFLPLTVLSSVIIIAGCAQTPVSNNLPATNVSPQDEVNSQARSTLETEQAGQAGQTEQSAPTEQIISTQQTVPTQQITPSPAVAPLLDLTTQQPGTISPIIPPGGRPVVQTGWKTYTSSKYGFEISYPQDLQLDTGFKTFHLLTGDWRVEAPDTSKGTAVISIPVFKVENDASFPRYFVAEVRIGVSTNGNDVKNCLKPDPNWDVKTTTQTINGTTFTLIPFGDAAMMQYINVDSYRAVHNGTCFAVEQVENGSNYQDTPTPQDIPQKELDGYYNLAGEIIKTFKFTK